MDEQHIREKCEQFLKSLGVPGFIVFGWEKGETVNPETKKSQKQYGVISSYHKMPKEALLKGMAWAMNDVVNKTA